MNCFVNPSRPSKIARTKKSFGAKRCTYDGFSFFLILIQVPLFQGTELGFTKMLSLYIQPLLVPKGEYIVRKGDIGEEVCNRVFLIECVKMFVSTVFIRNVKTLLEKT